jgi:glycosyltransferase involved in cell wall biosynthesis
MYLIPILVPIYLRGGERLVTTDWKRSLLLLRDSLNGRYGPLRVIAPWVDARTTPPDQPLEPVSASDEIELIPSFPNATRAREFWTQHVHTWRRDIAAALPTVDVVHAGMCEVYRPLTFIGFLSGLSAQKPTVFVQDTDQVLQHAQLHAGRPLRERLEARVYCEVFERCTRFGVARASLSLLKGEALRARYGRYAKNAKNFHDTSYFTRDVMPQALLEQRITGLLRRDRPLRLVYCGRLEARKGLDESIRALMLARSRDARVTLDIIGDGAERGALAQLSENLGADTAVRFLGSRAYGPALLSELSSYDALLFTPLAEDTPRMIFDGYAAGLPLLGYGIDYVREREAEDGAARSVAVRDVSALATLLCEVDRERRPLAALSECAREAARFHAADAWYQRRADWTHEAVADHHAARRIRRAAKSHTRSNPIQTAMPTASATRISTTCPADGAAARTPR